uniref:G-protein coupled receptors family 1 profile domain-containing protein n=1 Tax=Strongyloides stercoralis TaxID=6248 RepID=A0A0K0EQY6_STRER
MSFPIEEKLLISFEIFSFILYFIIIIYLNLNYKKNNDLFSISFIIQFTFNGICDFMSALSVIMYRKVAIWGWLREYYIENNWVTWAYTLTFYQFTSLTITGNFLITLNRYMTITNPIFYKIKWTFKVAIFIIIFQTVICFGVYTHLYFVSSVFVYDPSIPTWYFTKSKWIYSLYDSICLITICWISAIATGLLNVLICLKYNKIFKSSLGNKKNSKIPLFIFTLLTSSILFITAIQQTIRLRSAIRQERWLRNLMNYYFFYILPLLSCVHAYLMIFLSKQIRNDFYFYFKKYILRRKIPKVNSTIQTTKWREKIVI